MANIKEQASIAVLSSQMNEVIKRLDNIDKKQSEQVSLYVTRSEFGEFKQRWFFSHTLAAIAGAVMSGLVVYYLTNK